ncbi:MAG: UDP-galactopyranose mutase [Clostridiales bacterium]|jgi:UDP-galactopyranose mutase|nr:UDP-galactopyranose mutase [Clostridiales bacterium]
MYDYLIVGSGLYGAIFAHEATKRGKKCLVIEKRAHIGGNAYTEQVEGVTVHRYGPHIFHTNDTAVWEYINRFAEFNNYINAPIANYNGEIYNLPFNMNTFYKLWGTHKPEKAMEVIESQRLKTENPQNLEEQALSLVGRDIFEKLIKEYTEKQWGRKCKDLPAFIIKRLPVRFTYNNNYFNDRYQGIPIGGYTQIIEKMLQGSDVRLNTDYFSQNWDDTARKTVYTGPVDEFFAFKYGRLKYRTLRFETEVLDTGNYQGNAIVNYTSAAFPWTRIIEHKHFEYGAQPKTVITKEFSKEFETGDEPYYPVNDEKNNSVAQKYFELAAQRENVIFGGRLGEYKYYDMWQVIKNALEAAEAEFR